MKRFEYHTLDVPVDNDIWGGKSKIDTQKLSDALNELGKEGWELVSSVDLNIAYGASKSVLFMLKRELQ